MPTYPTPAPVDLAVGLAGRPHRGRRQRPRRHRRHRAPHQPGREAADVRGAEDTAGRLRRPARHRDRRRDPASSAVIGPTESVDLIVELPTGSRLTVETAVGDVRTTGRLGATRIKSSHGCRGRRDDRRTCGAASAHGNATVGTAEGGVEVTADHGQIRIGTVTGDAVLKAAHGSVTARRVGGDLDARLSYGDLDLTRARGLRRGQDRLRQPARGRGVAAAPSSWRAASARSRSACAQGVAAWLDLSSKRGPRPQRARRRPARPAPDEQTVAVRARTQFGDIDVRRAG